MLGCSPIVNSTTTTSTPTISTTAASASYAARRSRSARAISRAGRSATPPRCRHPVRRAGERPITITWRSRLRGRSRWSRRLRICPDRQRPMKNVTLDRATALQLDANGTDSALDAAADRHVLRNDAALDLCPIVDLEIRGAHLAFDSAEDLRWTFAFDVADDRHVGADARGHSRFCRRF